jgi:hypothetical protein
MTRWICGLFLALLCAAPALAGPDDRIGRVRTVDGAASILRAGALVPVAVGDPILRGDVLRTGRSGAIGVVLEDETTISLGSGSELAMVDFAYRPKEGRFALVMRMARGTFSYLAGMIAKLAPGTVQLQLPDATIAVRGTKLLIQIEE